MKMKFFIGFAILGLSLASAKSYEISVDTVSKVGDVQLKPGAYKVTLDGSKFDATALETVENNGVTTVNEIDLGGTRTDIKFK